jgi:cell pole-organizing protein PopZ
MEDILASIRRILSEDEAPAEGGAPALPPASGDHVPEHIAEGANDGVLMLDPAMMVAEPTHAVAEPPAVAPIPLPPPMPPTMATELVAPEAAAAAASSVGSLMRTLAAERTMQVRSGGPTIEDMVREEIRPLLKAWLDANLPPMVERLVSAEIARVVGRGAA